MPVVIANNRNRYLALHSCKPPVLSKVSSLADAKAGKLYGLGGLQAVGKQFA